MDDMLLPSAVSDVAAGGGQSSSHPGASVATIRTEDLKAAQAPRNIGRAQLTTDTQCITYATVAPMVADVVRWLESLLPGDITIHLELPSILAPLRLYVKYLTPSWMAQRRGVYGHGWSQLAMPWKC